MSGSGYSISFVFMFQCPRRSMPTNDVSLMESGDDLFQLLLLVSCQVLTIYIAWSEVRDSVELTDSNGQAADQPDMVNIDTKFLLLPRKTSSRRSHRTLHDVFPLLHHARNEVGLNLQEAKMPSVPSFEGEPTQFK
jgi:hypothetical protein